MATLYVPCNFGFEPDVVEVLVRRDTNRVLIYGTYRPCGDYTCFTTHKHHYKYTVVTGVSSSGEQQYADVAEKFRYSRYYKRTERRSNNRFDGILCEPDVLDCRGVLYEPCTCFDEVVAITDDRMVHIPNTVSMHYSANTSDLMRTADVCEIRDRVLSFDSVLERKLRYGAPNIHGFVHSKYVAPPGELLIAASICVGPDFSLYFSTHLFNYKDYLDTGLDSVDVFQKITR